MVEKIDSMNMLTLKEEAMLSQDELDSYYNGLCQYVKDRKLTNTTRGATTIAPKLKRITNVVADKMTDVLAGGAVVKISDGQGNIPDGPVIFAHTHQGILDNFSWIPATPRHAIIFHSAVVKKFLIVAQLNTGLILVNKGDSQSRSNAKLDTIKLLLEGHSIAFFPESAWNLSPNKLHLPMNFGFIDIAKKAGVPIVPVVDEYTYDSSVEKERIKRIHIRFGKPIQVTRMDSLKDKLEEYQEAISTIRWELFEEKGVFRRDDISNKEYMNFIEGNLKNLKMGGIDVNIEQKYSWNSEDEFYVFHNYNVVPYDKNGSLLGTEEEEKLKKLNWILG